MRRISRYAISFTISLLLAGTLWGVGASPAAATTAPADVKLDFAKPPMITSSTNESVFAFAGATCPVSSTPYEGPEGQKIKETGAVYCVFKRSNVFALKKSILPNAACPGFMKPYVDKTYKPAGDIVWCELPPPPGLLVVPQSGGPASAPVPTPAPVSPAVPAAPKK